MRPLHPSPASTHPSRHLPGETTEGAPDPHLGLPKLPSATGPWRHVLPPQARLFPLLCGFSLHTVTVATPGFSLPIIARTGPAEALWGQRLSSWSRSGRDGAVHSILC